MIKVTDLHFTYPRMKEEALKGIDFEVLEGEVFGLLGPSGAGKSTLQKVLLGLLKGYRGQVFVMKKEVSKLQGEYYNKIGVGFELPNLYEQLTILDNLRTFAKLYEKPADIDGLLKEVGLYEHKMKKVSQISKGMKMRLNFCRSLIGTPEVLFLDEPTSGLDPNNTRVIRDRILEYKKSGKTVVLTTHNMSFAEQICDKVAFIVEGEVKEMGEPESLKKKYGVAKVCVEDITGVHTFDLKDIGENKEFSSLLKREGLISIDTQKPSLEEIFTLVTGRVLI